MSTNDKLKNCLRTNLLKKRNELAITQESMAEKLNLSRRAYQKLEYGESFCRAETLIYLVVNFDFDNEKLFSDFGKAIDDSER